MNCIHINIERAELYFLVDGPLFEVTQKSDVNDKKASNFLGRKNMPASSVTDSAAGKFQSR